MKVAAITNFVQFCKSSNECRVNSYPRKSLAEQVIMLVEQVLLPKLDIAAEETFRQIEKVDANTATPAPPIRGPVDNNCCHLPIGARSCIPANRPPAVLILILGVRADTDASVDVLRGRRGGTRNRPRHRLPPTPRGCQIEPGRIRPAPRIRRQNRQRAHSATTNLAGRIN